ncbi:MAG TPA: hypothetical protein VFK85_09990 [Anaeromyxobacteraceae bacterium]|nr:hypothetical protein [Anaeromyxobacteraceae bacterium]
MTTRIAAAALALVTAGCASIVQGPYQRVSFETQPSGATVRAAMQSCTTPCSLRLKRNQNLDADVRKPGYDPEVVYIRYELDPWILGNVVFLPFMGVGGIVDIVTGAGFRLYPPFVVVPLRTSAESAPEPLREQPERAPTPERKPDSDEDWKPIPREVI